MISFDLVKQAITNFGQIYIALNRLTSLAFCPIDIFNSAATKLELRVIHEYWEK